MSTRRVVLSIGGSILGGLAGCTGFLDDATRFEASPGTVPGSVLEETGYEERQVRDFERSRTFEGGGRSQTVRVVNWQAEYDKAIDLPTGDRVQGAIFSVLSTPQVRVLDREFNPVAKMDDEDLAEQVQERYSAVEDLERVGERTPTMLGKSVTVGKYDGRAQLQAIGQSFDVIVHIGNAIEHRDDFVVPIGAYPKLATIAEEESLVAMIEGVEH